MILVLTYHRIVQPSAPHRGFFDVSTRELEAHLHRLKETWSQCISPSEFPKLQNHDRRSRIGFVPTFDDGTADHYFNAAPLLERNGVRGVFFVNTSLLGTEGYLTLDQCRELNRRGHAIESHAHEHVDLTGLPTDELRRQLGESRRRLQEAGLGQCEFLAVPGGYFNQTVMASARACGYSCLRTIEWGFNGTWEPYRVESFIINRRTAGRWFASLTRPRFEAAKKAAFRVKELLKNRLPSVYSRLKS